MIKRLRGIRLLLLVLAAGAGLLVWGRSSGEARAALLAQQAAVASRYPADFAVQLPLEQPRSLAGAEPVFGLSWLSGWTEPGRPHYGLFLPAAAQRTGTRIWLGSEDLLLDGEPLRNGQNLTIAAGEHLLSRTDGSASWPFLALYGSEIPCVFLQTDTGVLTSIYADKQYEESASITLLQPNGVLEYSGEVEAMRGHGNQTWEGHGKKSFQIKFSDRISILGMPRARRWLLIGNAYDKSLVRNHTVFSLAQAVGMPYTPEGEFVEVYINGIYHGCYLLCEKVEVDENRVAIQDMDDANAGAAQAQGLEWDPAPTLYQKGDPMLPGHRRYARLAALPEDNTGGYLIELETPGRYAISEEAGFVTRMGQYVCIKSPEPVARSQVEYIASLYQQMEDLIYPPEEDEAEQGDAPDRQLEEIIDLHSFAQKYLIEEITKNLDAVYTSQYFYKPPDSVSLLLFAGPVWDYDKSLASEGAVLYEDLSALAIPEGFWACNQQCSYALWAGLYEQPAFLEETRRCFFTEFLPEVQRMLEEGQISADTALLADSAYMDALRWHSLEYKNKDFRLVYQQEAEKIEAFLAARLEFLKGEWLEEPQ